jgi:hypothetical protein
MDARSDGRHIPSCGTRVLCGGQSGKQGAFLPKAAAHAERDQQSQKQNERAGTVKHEEAPVEFPSLDDRERGKGIVRN